MHHLPPWTEPSLVRILKREYCSQVAPILPCPSMSRQIPSAILDPVLVETLAQLEHQVFNFKTLADAQTEDNHGIIICDVLKIAKLGDALHLHQVHLDTIVLDLMGPVP